MYQERPLSDLHKLEDNPRTIDKESFRKLCASIESNTDYFKARPLILSDRTGKLVIIAGNQRYEAAKKLKLKTVPTFLLSNLTEQREKEILIRDNISNGDWDHELLSSNYEIEDLIEWGLDLPVIEEEDLPATEEQAVMPKLIVECELPNELNKLYVELQKRGFVCELK